MAKSGIACDDAVVKAFNDQKSGHTCKYILYKIKDDKTQIVLDGSGDAEWNDFVALLPANDCRYATFDFNYDQGGPKDKLVFITWCPDEAKANLKMIYASSKDAIKKKLDGIQVDFQANCISDLAYTEAYEKISKCKKI